MEPNVSTAQVAPNVTIAQLDTFLLQKMMRLVVLSRPQRYVADPARNIGDNTALSALSKLAQRVRKMKPLLIRRLAQLSSVPQFQIVLMHPVIHKVAQNALMDSTWTQKKHACPVATLLSSAQRAALQILAQAASMNRWLLTKLENASVTCLRVMPSFWTQQLACASALKLTNSCTPNTGVFLANTCSRDATNALRSIGTLESLLTATVWTAQAKSFHIWPVTNVM